MGGFLGFVALVFSIAAAIFSLGMSIDYWNGTARASLIYKQTGVQYTWREAAQIEAMYDQQNIRIHFTEEKKEKKND